MRKPWCDTKETSKGYCSSVPQAAGFQLCSKNRNLRTKIHQKNFKEDEDDLIIRLHALLGDRWPLIAGRLPGRTDAEIKKYWNTRLRWKLMRMGTDPAKHRMIGHNFPLHREQKEREQFAGSSVHDDSVSDTATSSEEKVCAVPDLNLGLTLS
nr:R3-MYB transcription factor [Lilium hybrid division I]